MKKKEWKARAKELDEENRQWNKSFNEAIEDAAKLRADYDAAVRSEADAVSRLEASEAALSAALSERGSLLEARRVLLEALATEKAAIADRDRDAEIDAADKNTLLKRIADRDEQILSLEADREALAKRRDGALKCIHEERQRSNDLRARLVARQTELDNLRVAFAKSNEQAERDVAAINCRDREIIEKTDTILKLQREVAETSALFDAERKVSSSLREQLEKTEHLLKKAGESIVALGTKVDELTKGRPPYVPKEYA